MSIKQLLAFGCGLALCSSVVVAQELADTVVEKEIDRDVSELDPRPVDPRPDQDVFNTAIVLTSYQGRDQVVRCVGFNARGNIVGKVRTKLPGDGVRLVFASDIADGEDYLGKVTCASRGDVVGSAYLVGPEFNDLAVINESERAGSFIRVPVVLSR